jgi:hypothetical protein
LIVNAVNRYYDESIHEENLKEFIPKKITSDIKEDKIPRLDGRKGIPYLPSKYSFLHRKTSTERHK